jgi:hypothetical protein
MKECLGLMGLQASYLPKTSIKQKLPEVPGVFVLI